MYVFNGEASEWMMEGMNRLLTTFQFQSQRQFEEDLELGILDFLLVVGTGLLVPDSKIIESYASLNRK